MMHYSTQSKGGKPTSGLRRTMMSLAMGGAVVLGSSFGPAVAQEVAPPEAIKSAGQIVYCTEVAFPPWEMLDPQTQQPIGFDIDIGAAIAEAMGVESEHKDISFDGLIPALQAGQCDAIISGLYNKAERREVVDFVDYAKTATQIILKADSDLEIASLADLSGKKVAVGQGTAGEGYLLEANEELKAAGKDEIQIVAMPSSAVAFQQLQAGLVAAYLGSTDQAGYFNSQNPDSVKLGGEPLSPLPTGIATLHKDKELHEAIQAAFETIVESGKYKEIIEKWGFEELAIR